MRLPRVRFTVRGMMVAVAIVAVVIGAVLLRQRSLAYRIQANWWASLERPHFETAILRDGESERHASQVESLRREAAENPEARERMEIAARRSKRFAEIAGDERALAEHYRSLRIKYERAARYPWLPVEPDPPEPE